MTPEELSATKSNPIKARRINKTANPRTVPQAKKPSVWFAGGSSDLGITQLAGLIIFSPLLSSEGYGIFWKNSETPGKGLTD